MHVREHVEARRAVGAYRQFDARLAASSLNPNVGSSVPMDEEFQALAPTRVKECQSRT